MWASNQSLWLDTKYLSSSISFLNFRTSISQRSLKKCRNVGLIFFCVSFSSFCVLVTLVCLTSYLASAFRAFSASFLSRTKAESWACRRVIISLVLAWDDVIRILSRLRKADRPSGRPGALHPRSMKSFKVVQASKVIRQSRQAANMLLLLVPRFVFFNKGHLCKFGALWSHIRRT